jgi:hypothetical protein
MSKSKLQVSAQGWSSAQRLATENRLFAILDACDTPAVSQKADELGFERALSLYTGRLDQEHWAIGPYLFRMDNAALEWLSAQGKREPWGVFAIPKSPEVTLQGLFAHFRKFVTIRAGEREVYFRFYDPRVLPQYLRRAPDEKLQEFFGPCTFLGAKEAEEVKWYWLRET